jgi:hypothetical protein
MGQALSELLPVGAAAIHCAGCLHCCCEIIGTLRAAPMQVMAVAAEPDQELADQQLEEPAGSIHAWSAAQQLRLVLFDVALLLLFDVVKM